jgi:hypothetical protein
VPGGYNWATLSLGDIHKRSGSPGCGLDARLTTLFYKKIIIVKSEEMKTGSNPAESSKEGYGSKRAVLSVMM